MNIVIFTHNLPYPPTNGGRIDIWNRILAFKQLNHNVFLVAWAIFDDNKSDESFAEVEKVVDELVCFKRKDYSISRLFNLFSKIVNLPFQPSVVTGCRLLGPEFKSLHNRIKQFQPTFFFVESVYAANLAYKYSALLKLPLFIRSHNIEHLYITKQLRSSRTLIAKIKLFGMNAQLANYEKRILKAADCFFDISLSDLSYWESNGYSNGYYMPPLYFEKDKSENYNPPYSLIYDICFIGNLYSPNNLESIMWFIKEVLPILQKSQKHIKLLISGSHPSKELIDYCTKFSNITLIANPKDVNKLYYSSKVLINPILFGSGVNIKSVEMLFCNKPVVCTKQAIAGLPSGFQSVFHIADTSSQFSSIILKLLNDYPYSINDLSLELKKYFSLDYFKICTDKMQELCKHYKTI